MKYCIVNPYQSSLPATDRRAITSRHSTLAAAEARLAKEDRAAKRGSGSSSYSGGQIMQLDTDGRPEHMR